MKKRTVAAVTCSVSAIIALVITLYAGEIRTGQPGLEIIGNAEGCRREPYLCPARVLTVGIGSTKDVQRNRQYSDREIANLWVKDIIDAERCINSHFHGADMPQPVFEAVTSLAFNVGCYGIRRNKAGQPTRLASAAARGDWSAVCDAIPDYNRAGGKVLSGLVKRRAQEQALCRQGVQ